MKQKLILYYDHQCPFCKNYAAFVTLKKQYDLELKDARVYLSEIHNLCRDININDGLIVYAEGKCLQGIDALRYLDSAMEKRGILSQLHGIWHLKKPAVWFLYGYIKLLRKAVLFLMGRKNRIE